MTELKFHFAVTKEHYTLNQTLHGRIQVILSWPKKGYSREKALNRADRAVGEMVRQADARTCITYTQEVPTI